jgi:hypothetical protein
MAILQNNIGNLIFTSRIKENIRAPTAVLTLTLFAILFAPMSHAGCLSDPAQQCSSTINGQGQVGLTSYAHLPFAGHLYAQSWGSSPGLAPANLFWQSGSNFTNPNTMLAARQFAAKLTGQGTIPASGAQRWEDTYEISRPASLFPGEPSWINADRYSQNLINQPEYKAWVLWEKAHANLFMVGADGGPEGPDFRPWKGDWGHISPLMPLPAADWPPGVQNATYGDWYAYRWGQTAARSGAYGIMLSDFSDSQPAYPSYQIGFNSQIVDRFQAQLGRTIPGGSVPQRAGYINTHFLVQWNDFLANGYARFYSALASRLHAATGHEALIVDQCGQWPSARRFQGTDAYVIAHTISPANYICIWDDQTMQLGRSGQSMTWGIGGMVIAAAREPDIRNGGNLSANDSAFWQAAAHFWSNLTSSEQHERGLKELRRAWLETSWSHIATRQGTVRRALAFMARDYWDKGALDATLQKQIQTIVPTRPFGYAVYYSRTTERAIEANVLSHGGVNESYMNPDKLFAFKNGGGPVGYYVSDAALPALTAAARPAAWVILDVSPPASEMQKLSSVAPVLRSLAEARAFANAPLAFSKALTGMGFYDQHNRLIVTVSNPGGSGVNGTVTFRTLAAGTYVATDLFSGAKVSFNVSNGKGTLPLGIERWDTRAFAIVPA